MRIRRLAMVPLVVVAAACSSGSSKSTAPSTSTPSTATASSTAAPAAKARYLSKVNALCRTMNSRITALGAPASDPASQAEFNDRAIAITAGMLGQIRAVAKPPADADALTAIYAKVDLVLTDARSLSAALRAGDQNAAEAAQTKLNADSKSANDATIAYGLTVCGS
jgi:hypothetical protein